MQLNFLELQKWVRENKDKIDTAIIKKVYRTYKDGIILELFKPNLDKKYLYLIPGLAVFLSDKKINLPANNFVMRLRKDFDGRRIKIYMYDNERILVVQSNDNKKILVELLSPGNIVVVDENDTILYALLQKDFGIRKIKRGEKYIPPPSNFKIPTNFEEFREIIVNSKRKDIVRALAIDLRLGGKYAELLLGELKIDKNKKPKDLSNNELERLWIAYKSFLDSNKVYYDEWSEDVNGSIEKFYLRFLEEESLIRLKEKKEKIENILKTQLESKERLQKEIERMQKIGNFLITYSWIFEEYNPEKIKKEFESLGIKLGVEDDGLKLKIKIREEDLEKLI